MRPPVRVSAWAVGLTAVIAAGAAVRLTGLGRESFWFNEAASYFYAKGSAWEVARRSWTIETNPPLFHLLIHFWKGIFSASEAALRFPSALAGAATLLVMIPFARLFLGWAGTLAAVALLALSPLHVWYSQECRAFALWVLCITAAYVCYFQWEQNGRARWLGANGALLFLAVGLHYFGFHAALIENLYFLFQWKRFNWHRRRAWIGSQAALALALAPWAWMMARVDRSHVAWWADSGMEWSVFKSLWFQLNGVFYYLTPQRWAKAAVLAINAAMLVWGWCALRKNGPRRWFLALAILLPVVLNIIFSLALTPILGNAQSAGRYFLLTLPPFVIIIAAGWQAAWERLARPKVWAAALACFLTVYAYGIHASRANAVFVRDDNLWLCGRLLREAAPGDCVIAAPLITLDYYADRLGCDLGELHVIETHRNDSTLESRLPERASRVWLYLDPTHHYEGLADRLASRYGLRIISDERPPGLSGAGLTLLARKNSTPEATR